VEAAPQGEVEAILLQVDVDAAFLVSGFLAARHFLLLVLVAAWNAVLGFMATVGQPDQPGVTDIGRADATRGALGPGIRHGVARVLDFLASGGQLLAQAPGLREARNVVVVGLAPY